MGQYVVIGNAVVFYRRGVDIGVRGVNAVDILGKQDDVGADLGGPERRRRVCGEKGIAGAAAEDDHPPLFQVPDRPAADIWFCDGAHLDGGLYPDVHAFLLQYVGERQTVDYRCQHSHMVGPGAFHFAAAVLHAAPEIASADHDSDLDTKLKAFSDHVAHFGDHFKVEPSCGIARQRFSADFQEYAFIARFTHMFQLLPASWVLRPFLSFTYSNISF
ncbi:hypothetical protein SDC9_86792 [bioreactor metagenome]|uniref:Uncharacterized protein n=1 Tax=bioreactor metagenome TaxID=1076179 RepID=A0A644ZN82_9ZZZZ